jgi:hypothetical protein
VVGSPRLVGNPRSALVGNPRGALHTDLGACLELHTVALAVVEVGETGLSDVDEVVWSYDELVMRCQCMKRWDMLTVPLDSRRVTGGQSLVAMLCCSGGDSGLSSWRGEEVFARGVRVGCVHLVASGEPKVGHLKGHHLGDSHCRES